MSNVQYQPQQYQNVQEVLDQQGLSNLPPNSVVYYQVNGGPPQSYNPNQQYYVQQESDEFVPQGFVRTTQVTQQAPKVPPHQNLQTSQTKYQQQDQQKQNVQQFQQRGQQQFQQNVQQQPQQGGQQQQYQQSQQVGQQQFQQRQQPQQAGQPQFQQPQQVGQQQFQQQRTQPQQQYQQAQQSQRQFQQPGQQQQQQNVQYDQYPQEFTDSRFQGYSENDYNDPYRYQHAIQRAERAQSEKRSYLVDADGNYQSVADAPTYTTKEPDGTPAVSYSAFPRRAKSVEPAAGAAEVGYLYGGSDFIDHTQDYFDINGELVDLTIHAPPKFIRRDGDNYGLDFNSSVHRGENVDVEEDYTGYHAQKPRKHWTYCEDPFNPDNTYVPDLFSYYDPNDLVGDTIANHRLLVEKQLTDEEREQFCTPFASTPGFLPQHRTEKPEPKEPGPICYSLSAKKELARDADYRPPSRSQSVGPVNAGYASGVQQKKDVNLLSLLDDSAIQRQANVIKPAPWAPESDYKQGRWQTSSQQLEPLNRRPQAEATQPEWSQQIQDKKSTFVGQQGGAQVQQPPYWQNQTAQPRGAWQEAAQRQGAQQPQQGQPGNVSTQYTYYQKGQQPQQVPQQQQQHPDANVAFTVQRGQGQQAQQVPQQQQRPGQQPVQRQPQQVQQQRPVAQQQQQTIQRRPQSQPPPQVQQRQQQPSQQYQQITTATTRTVVNGQPVQQQQSLGQPQGQQVKQVGFAQQQQPLNVANGNVGRQQPQQFRQGQQIQAQNVVNKQQPQQQVRQVPGKPVQQNGTIPAVAPKPGQQQFAQGQPQQQSQQVRYVQQPQGQTQQTFITSQGQYYTQGGQPQQGQVTNQQTIYKQVKVQR